MEENENERDQIHDAFTNSQKYLEKTKKKSCALMDEIFPSCNRIFNFVKTQEMVKFYLIDSTYR